MSEFSEVTRWAEGLAGITEPAAIKRILAKGGEAGKKAFLASASDSLGGDRKFRNWARKPALTARYEPSGSSKVDVLGKPVGLWKLAESGRHNVGDIYRRGETPSGKRTKGSAKKFRKAVGSFHAGQHAPAVKTPKGPRAHSRYKSSRGLHTFTNAERKAKTTVPKAAHEQFVTEIRSAIH